MRKIQDLTPNATAAWMPALTRVSDRAVSEIGTAITADSATMPTIDPAPKTKMKMNPSLERRGGQHHQGRGSAPRSPPSCLADVADGPDPPFGQVANLVARHLWVITAKEGLEC